MQMKALENEKCKNCVTFVDMEPVTCNSNSNSVKKSKRLETVSHSTYTSDYPGHKRISPPLVHRPQDALPIATDYKTVYVTTCQERFRPWDMKSIPRYESKAPRRQYLAPEYPMLSTTSYKDDFAKIQPLPDIQRMSRNKKKQYYSPLKMEPMFTGTTYKEDFGSWKVSIREIPPWARRKPRTSPPPFVAVTTQARDYSVPTVNYNDKAHPYRPKDGFTFIDKTVPMTSTTMYSCIHDNLQTTKDVYA